MELARDLRTKSRAHANRQNLANAGRRACSRPMSSKPMKPPYPGPGWPAYAATPCEANSPS
eukprot:2496286-Lingulodinium_polyedra.AAC.1